MIDLVEAVEPVSAEAAAAARERHNQLAKPPGSLGYVEELGIQLAAISGTCPPPVPSAAALIVAAADHGVHGQGISDWPQDVTGLMVATVAGGGAAVNAIARSVGAAVTVLDVGTVSPVTAESVVDARVRGGTRDITVEPAMTLDECVAAVAAGARVAQNLVNSGADLLATGDLGIGNTTTSACLIAAFTGEPEDVVTGRGANRDDGRLPHKINVVKSALERHGAGRDPHGTLASLGGLEHAALVGVILAGAANRVPVVLDGVIADAAALAAVRLCPAASGYLIAGHGSAEPGAAVALAVLGKRPVLQLGMRLGEGTGALLAVPIIQAAARVLAEMATLEDVLASGSPTIGAMPTSRCYSTTVTTDSRRRVVVPVPFDPDEAWGSKDVHRLRGTVNGMGVRAILEADSPGHVFVLGAAWRRECGISPGDEVTVELAPEGPQRADLAPDVAAALENSPGAGAFFDSLAQFYRTAYLRWIDGTKRRPDVRAARIAEMVEFLEAGHKERPRDRP